MRATSRGRAVIVSPCRANRIDDREQEPVQRPRAEPGEEPVLVPFDAAGAFAPSSGQVAGGEGDPEEDEDDLGDVPHRHIQGCRVEAEPAGEQLEVEVAEHGVGDDLKDRVEGDEHGGGFAVATGEVVPDEHHGDAAGQADDDEAGAIGRQVGEHQPGESEHERRADHPVEHQRCSHEGAVGGDLRRSGSSAPWRAPGTSSPAGRWRSGARPIRS